MITEFLSFVLFVLLLAVSGYAMFLHTQLARIANKANRADKSIARHKAKVAEWIAYADYLESELSRYVTEYAGVRLDYDIMRGKVKAAPIKNGNGAKAYALTLPGMAIPSDCDVELSPVVEDIYGNVTGGVPIVVRKPEQKSKNGAKSGDSDKSNANSAAKSEKTEKQAESKPNDTKRDPQSVIADIEKTTGKLESHEADRVVTWLKSAKTGDKTTAEYAKWIAGIRKSKK